jgi:hypothetical protein
MMRSKTWVKDKYFEYELGALVKLVRKKKNGHPRSLKFELIYKVIKIENQDLFVIEYETKHNELYGTQTESIKKVNKNYFVPFERLRDEIINDILSND